MQKSMQKTLAMILLTLMVAATLIGFVSAVEPAIHDSTKCNDPHCNEDCCQTEPCDDCIDPTDPKDPPVIDPPAGGDVEDPAAAGGDPEENSVSAADDTVAMQKTGVPMGIFGIAVLMLIAGLVIPKRK